MKRIIKFIKKYLRFISEEIEKETVINPYASDYKKHYTGYERLSYKKY